MPTWDDVEADDEEDAIELVDRALHGTGMEIVSAELNTD